RNLRRRGSRITPTTNPSHARQCARGSCLYAQARHGTCRTAIVVHNREHYVREPHSQRRRSDREIERWRATSCPPIFPFLYLPIPYYGTDITLVGDCA